MKDGRGFPIIHGDGLLFIMAAGLMTLITDGYGLRITNGARDGLAGEGQMIIMDGHPSVPGSVLKLLMEMGTIYPITSGPL